MYDNCLYYIIFIFYFLSIHQPQIPRVQAHSPGPLQFNYLAVINAPNVLSTQQQELVTQAAQQQQLVQGTSSGVHPTPAQATLPQVTPRQALPKQAQAANAQTAPPANSSPDGSAFITLLLMNSTTGAVDLMKVNVVRRHQLYATIIQQPRRLNVL